MSLSNDRRNFPVPTNLCNNLSSRTEPLKVTRSEVGIQHCTRIKKINSDYGIYL
jgi:hypothetical protein